MQLEGGAFAPGEVLATLVAQTERGLVALQPLDDMEAAREHPQLRDRRAAGESVLVALKAFQRVAAVEDAKARRGVAVMQARRVVALPHLFF